MLSIISPSLASGYSITLKLKEAVESALPKKSNSDAFTELTDHHHQQQQQPQEQQLHKVQRKASNGKKVAEDAKPEKVDSINKREQLRREDAGPTKPEWVVSINKLEKLLREDAESSGPNLRICRIPHYLKDGEDNAWVPQIVSLGPYHHGKEHLRHMEKHKSRCLNRIILRTEHEKDLYQSVTEVEKQARDYYEGPISMKSEEFVNMMVLDGCFVIELFLGFTIGFEKMGHPCNDSIFSMQRSMHKIQQDMIMLENQIPLFILDRLLGLQLGDPNQKGLAAKLALRFFNPPQPTDDPLTEVIMNRTDIDLVSDQCKLHCLEVFRWNLLHLGQKRVGNHRPLQRRQQLIHCVTELWEAGIEFKKRKTDKFWDIQFKNGVLYIPKLVIHDGTRSCFLNLIAFEQCNFDCSNHITSYVIFMDNLINSAEDVGHLHSCGIIEHWLGSNTDVANLFNRLCQGVAFDIKDSYLCRLSEEVNKYYSNRWNGWIAGLKHKYFSNPWSIISVIAAFILLALTFTQTFYGVYGYYRKGS
ncbi:hypothetical protein EUGRSUZ_I00852 [Eucalyptus grandis]|uniref:Uncharacterized protein n=2 Tax=Eucalyptus grandis TaxID=71139 RepID=A0A059ALM5_EUCGR|nr:hypothetical protein EUGRSUZ_I00852 [Eucalyptus grandis]